MAEQGAPEKTKALDQALGQIEKAYGKIMLLKRRLEQKDLAGKW